MSIQIQPEGRRLYLIGNTFPIKGKLSNLGATWDADRRAWWIGSTKKTAVESLLSSSVAAGNAASQQDTLSEESKIAGKAKYKGREYLMLWEGETKRGRAAKLAFRDGSKIFWAGSGEYEVTKHYHDREYRGRIEVGMTFGRLNRLAAEFNKAKAEGREKCWKCGGFNCDEIKGCYMCGCGRCEGARGGLCEED